TMRSKCVPTHRMTVRLSLFMTAGIGRSGLIRDGPGLRSIIERRAFKITIAGAAFGLLLWLEWPENRELLPVSTRVLQLIDDRRLQWATPFWLRDGRRVTAYYGTGNDVTQVTRVTITDRKGNETKHPEPANRIRSTRLFPETLSPDGDWLLCRRMRLADKDLH